MLPLLRGVIRTNILRPDRLSHSVRYANSFLSRSCPSCGAASPSPIPACPKCSHISPIPSTLTAHKLFGLPENPNPFLVDIPTLKQRFREAQAICHPDSWASKGLNKQNIAHSLSTHINEAYQHLLKPLARAEYILEQHGHGITEHDQMTDIDFISNIMQAREVIAETESKNEIDALVEDTEEEIAETLQDISSQVEGQNWEATKRGVMRLRYLEGIERAAKRRLEQMTG